MKRDLKGDTTDALSPRLDVRRFWSVELGSQIEPSSSWTNRTVDRKSVASQVREDAITAEASVVVGRYRRKEDDDVMAVLRVANTRTPLEDFGKVECESKYSDDHIFQTFAGNGC